MYFLYSLSLSIPISISYKLGNFTPGLSWSQTLLKLPDFMIGITVKILKIKLKISAITEERSEPLAVGSVDEHVPRPGFAMEYFILF